MISGVVLSVWRQILQRNFKFELPKGQIQIYVSKQGVITKSLTRLTMGWVTDLNIGTKTVSSSCINMVSMLRGSSPSPKCEIKNAVGT
jgi:hypothetical protein